MGWRTAPPGDSLQQPGTSSFGSVAEGDRSQEDESTVGKDEHIQMQRRASTDQEIVCGIGVEGSTPIIEIQPGRDQDQSPGGIQETDDFSFEIITLAVNFLLLLSLLLLRKIPMVPVVLRPRTEHDFKDFVPDREGSCCCKIPTCAVPVIGF